MTPDRVEAFTEHWYKEKLDLSEKFRDSFKTVAQKYY